MCSLGAVCACPLVLISHVVCCNYFAVEAVLSFFICNCCLCQPGVENTMMFYDYWGEVYVDTHFIIFW